VVNSLRRRHISDKLPVPRRQPAMGSPMPTKMANSLLRISRMSDRSLTRIRQLTALCLLLCAVVMIGLAISGALKGGRSSVPQLASQK
jgi:hypothetical protein